MTTTRTDTYGRDDIRRVYASFAADYRIIAEWTELHRPSFIDATIDEIAWLADEEYLSEVHVQLKGLTGAIREAAVFRVSTNVAGWSSDRPGDLYWESEPGDALDIIVYWSQKWRDLDPSVRAALRAQHLPGWGESNFDGDYSGLTDSVDRQYTSGSYGIERTSYSR